MNMNAVMSGRKLSVLFIAASGVASLAYSYLLSDTERGLPVLDPFYIVVNVLWLALLTWVGRDVYRNGAKAKGLLLWIVFVVAAVTIFDFWDEDASMMLAGVSVIETLLLFAAYMMIRREPEDVREPS